jgi:predicted PurR-regulated permease PerM
VAITGAILGLALVCWQVLDVLVLIFAGCILAIVLTSLARLVERFTPLKGPWALTASTLGLPVLFAGLGALLGWRLTDEVSEG